ncbi:MAG TPA: metallophosphatase [Flavobacteriales bacterium]|nr:metallophosphatase [Flavobacteriales bacterium]
MNRRDFIKYGLAGVGLAALPFKADASGKKKRDVQKLLILHTNDVHSRVDPFPSTDPKYAGKGGVARRKTLIEKLRSENTHVLLFDCGDIFQGTPYFNLYGGEVELKAMSDMKYDAGTMGNHDFDNGIEGFLKVMPHANFPFICSNYDFSDTPLAGKTETYRVFNKGGIKVGVLGLGIELRGLVPDKLYGRTRWLDPIETAERVGEKLKKEEGCDLVVCLSHLGFKYDTDKVSDLVLARKTCYLDLILGGHTHTFLNEAVIEKNAANQNVLINQVGWGGIYLGSIFLSFQKNGKNKRNSNEISYIAGGNREIT